MGGLPIDAGKKMSTEICERHKRRSTGNDVGEGEVWKEKCTDSILKNHVITTKRTHEKNVGRMANKPLFRLTTKNMVKGTFHLKLSCVKEDKEQIVESYLVISR